MLAVVVCRAIAVYEPGVLLAVNSTSWNPPTRLVPSLRRIRTGSLYRLLVERDLLKRAVRIIRGKKGGGSYVLTDEGIAGRLMTSRLPIGTELVELADLVADSNVLSLDDLVSQVVVGTIDGECHDSVARDQLAYWFLYRRLDAVAQIRWRSVICEVHVTLKDKPGRAGAIGLALAAKGWSIRWVSQAGLPGNKTLSILAHLARPWAYSTEDFVHRGNDLYKELLSHAVDNRGLVVAFLPLMNSDRYQRDASASSAQRLFEFREYLIPTDYENLLPAGERPAIADKTKIDEKLLGKLCRGEADLPLDGRLLDLIDYLDLDPEDWVARAIFQRLPSSVRALGNAASADDATKRGREYRLLESLFQNRADAVLFQPRPDHEAATYLAGTETRPSTAVVHGRLQISDAPGQFGSMGDALGKAEANIRWISQTSHNGVCHVEFQALVAPTAKRGASPLTDEYLRSLGPDRRRKYVFRSFEIPEVMRFPRNDSNTPSSLEQTSLS